MAANHHQQLLEEKSSSSTSFGYSDVHHNHHHHLGVSHLQNFDSNPEIYNLASGIEMIGFQPKPHNLMVAVQQEQQHQQEMGFMDDSSSLRPCVFPCEGNERPSQGLSLSLSSSNPSTISLQSFELRHNLHLNHPQRFDLSSPEKSHSFHHLQQQQQHQPSSGSGSGSGSMSIQFEMMRNSKYMGPTQELLNEFCNLGTKQQDDDDDLQRKKQQSSEKKKKNKEQWEFEEEGRDDDGDRNSNQNNNASTSSNVNSSLYGVSLLELQKRKTKLLGMLEKVYYIIFYFFFIKLVIISCL